MSSDSWPTALLVAALLLSACTFHHVRRQCPSCVVIDAGAAPPPVAPGTRTIVLFVEGMFGFGPEWDAPRAAVAATPGASLQVFHWSPSSSLARVAAQLARAVSVLLAGAPASVRRLLVVGHSAAGLVTAFAAAQMQVPAGRRVHIVNVGAPYAGMHVTAFDAGSDFRSSVFLWSLGATFTRYPSPAPGVTIESWVTRWPPDPVMKPRFGHDPGAADVGPPGPRRPTPPGADHNRVLGPIVSDALRRLAD